MKIEKNLLNGNKVFNINDNVKLIITKKAITINVINQCIKSIHAANKIISKYDIPVIVFKHNKDIGAIDKKTNHMYYSKNTLKINLK
jgi:hypothetical protein